MTRFLRATLAAAAIGLLAFQPGTAKANVTLLNLGFNSSNVLEAINPGTGGTVIQTVGSTGPADVAYHQITVSDYVLGGGSFTAYLCLYLSSVGAADDTSVPGTVIQHYSGAFKIAENSDGSGKNYLSATFTNTAFGLSGGTGLTINAAEPPGTISFTSSEIPSAYLGAPKSASFGLSALNPSLGVITDVNSQKTIRAFTAASGSGTFSASVPEPSSLAIAGLGALGLIGYGIRRRRPV